MAMLFTLSHSLDARGDTTLARVSSPWPMLIPEELEDEYSVALSGTGPHVYIAISCAIGLYATARELLV